uniref:Transmembrane protein n=1 Tax=Panagrellus redivivus TaxID=6233 RepID=A0A7E4ZWH5_PANRE
MKNLNVTQGNLIVSVIFACLAGGMLISSILLERNAHEIVYDNRRRPMIPSRPPDELFFMDVHSRYPAFIIIIFSVAFQVTSLHPLYALWKAPSEAPTDDEAIDSNASKVEVKKLLILCLIIGFNTNALFFSFPFYVLSHHFYMNGDWMASFLFGRVIHTAICRRHEHSIVLAISFVVSGVAVCIFSFEPARLAASALYGLGFSMILPVLVLLVGRISYSYVYPLTSAFSLGPILFPPLLTTLLNSHGPQLFTSINFLLLIVTVFFFVWILNVQSRMDKPDGEHSAKVWRFFRGEGAFKRTRSLRKFIGSIRGSIRGRNYRRMQRASSPLGAPKASTGLHLQLGAPEDTNRLSPHYVSTYRSTQSRQKATIEVDDESSSTCTISISTPTPTSTTN